MRMTRLRVGLVAGVLVAIGLCGFDLPLWSQPAKGPAGVIRSARSGAWSAPATWEGGKVPQAGAKVQIRTGHTVLYDVQSDQAIRAIHVAGILRFANDKDTRLDVGLIRIQPGDEFDEEGFDCDHVPNAKPGQD